MKHQSSIKSAVTDELLRICCFLFYYVILIGLGAVILVGASWASLHLIMDVLPAVRNIRAMIFIVMITIGICLLALMLGIYLIKPLFSFHKNTKETRVEVFESECPELFETIKDIAKKTQCKMPKHVYLSPDVNACVFYDTSFWSIFFPIRKNLEIGLGLFDGTSIEEVKSIIAHEFGHFSQNSMKVGSTVYVTNTVLYNLIFTDDFWDKWLNEWCISDTGIIRYFGVFTRWLTNLIKHLTARVYRFVQKGYLKLSRYMEYDADSIACQCVGTDTFISALCKIEVLANKDNLYQQMLSSLINEQKMVSNYFVGKDIASKFIPNKEIPQFTYDFEFKEPVRTYKVDSRVRVEDIWASHPSLEDRITNARSTNIALSSNTKSISSWILIPQDISEKVSTLFISTIRNNVEDTLTYISDEQFTEWTAKEIEENFMDERLRPFFGNSILEFDLDHLTETPIEYPFNDENALKIAEFFTRIADWRLLNQIKNKEIEAKEVQIDGIVYKRKDIPFEKFKIELDIIHKKVVKIYSDIYAYVCNKCDENKRKSYRNSFAALFYAQHIRQELLPPLFAHRDKLLNELNRVTRRDEEEYKELCSLVKDYEQHLKKALTDIDLNWISATIGAEEYIKNLKDYLNKEHNSFYQVDVDAINEMFDITNGLSDIQEAVYNIAQRSICNITISVLDNK
ncbi:M48 family metallopeptidase [uncultured Bacteroides sp.]|uniref:M48 family metallopeptidase n=1 Tax=uncultured Bacteroides sp. TaxID=162156 RepID=UPI0026145325|nr:M48 family metallopeptidase [uncultured Bacteroides sp.]